MISVVIPLYNKQQTIGRALRSVFDQTFQGFEVIVVNDGSTDASAAEARWTGNGRVRIVHQSNAGVAAARNRGVAIARSEWVAFLDADDEWTCGFLAAVARLRRDFPRTSLCATSYVLRHRSFGERPAILRGVEPGFRGVLTDYFHIASLSEPPIAPSTVLLNKQALLEAGGFPVGVASGEDLLTWARIAVAHRIAFDARPLVRIYAPLGFEERPTRVPSEHDVVGLGLKRMLVDASEPQATNLRAYLAVWHRMRASTLLQAGHRTRCVAEICRAAEYGGWSSRLAGMALLSLGPTCAAKWIVQTWRGRKLVPKINRAASHSGPSHRKLNDQTRAVEPLG